MLHVKHIKVEKEKIKKQIKEKTKKIKYFPGNKTVKDNVTRETYKSGKRKNKKTNKRKNEENKIFPRK